MTTDQLPSLDRLIISLTLALVFVQVVFLMPQMDTLNLYKNLPCNNHPSGTPRQ